MPFLEKVVYSRTMAQPKELGHTPEEFKNKRYRDLYKRYSWKVVNDLGYLLLSSPDVPEEISDYVVSFVHGKAAEMVKTDMEAEKERRATEIVKRREEIQGRIQAQLAKTPQRILDANRHIASAIRGTAMELITNLGLENSTRSDGGGNVYDLFLGNTQYAYFRRLAGAKGIMLNFFNPHWDGSLEFAVVVACDELVQPDGRGTRVLDEAYKLRAHSLVEAFTQRLGFPDTEGSVPIAKRVYHPTKPYSILLIPESLRSSYAGGFNIAHRSVDTSDRDMRVASLLS